MKKVLFPFASLLLATPVFSQCPEDRCTNYFNRTCDGVMAAGDVELSLQNDSLFKVTENDGFTQFSWYIRYYCDQDSLVLQDRPVLYGPCQAEHYIEGYGLLKDGYIEIHEWERPYYMPNDPGIWTCRQWVTEDFLLSEETNVEDPMEEIEENILYPNPAQGEFTLNPGDQWSFPLEVLCVDLRGQVLQKWLLEQSDFPTTVDASSLAPGTYVIQLNDSSEKRSMQRLVLR